MSELLFEEETGKILGACFEVYKQMGCGFQESVYQECLEVEFDLQNIPAIPQSGLKLTCKGRELKQVYRPDFLCHEKIVVELKAVSTLTEEHEAQVINYLHATHYRVGLLVNFGHFPGLQFKRRVL
jgi:GxxExxY protein